MRWRCASRRCAEGVAAALLLGALAGCAGAPKRAPSPAQEAAATSSQSAARAWRRGDLDKALDLYAKALAAADSIEDFDAGGAALLNLALVHARRDELREAHARIDRILAAPERYGAALHAQAAARKALLYLDEPDFDAALQWAQAAQKACVEPCVLGAVLSDVRAHVALERGDPALAATLAARGVEQAHAAGQEAERANALRLLGRAQTRTGRTTEAADSLAQALAIDRSLGLPERVALDLVYAAENEERRAQKTLAKEYYERALSVYRAAGNRRGVDAVRARLSQ